MERIRDLQTTPRMSHADLDEATELDMKEPVRLGQENAESRGHS
jgi:hypothetical protein